MNKTYLFHDIETTGLNKAFDQVIQFAAIRADEKLNELERHNFFVKLNPDIIPSPEAIITHRIAINKCQQQGIPEVEAIRKIHRLLNTPGTISIGYNTLSFDDEFLRFTFYRNLLSPYTHQWANQCGRMDLYPMATMYYLYQSDVLQWPMIDDKPSLKLENLSKLNQLAIGQAHNAMTDIEASLALAKRLHHKSKMWNYLTGYFDKKTDVSRITKLTEQALLVDGHYGSANNFQYPVISIGHHNYYKNQTLWLRLDHPELNQSTPDAPNKHSWVINKKPGELGFLLPSDDRYMEKISQERQAIMKKNLTWLEKNNSIYQQIISYHRDYKHPNIPNLDIDAALYQSDFLTDQELHYCREFHLEHPEDKSEMIDELPERLQEQAIRIMARNYPDYLQDEYYDLYDQYLTRINSQNEYQTITDYRNEPRLTPNIALKKIETMLKDDKLDTEQKSLLKELTDYIQSIFK